MVVTVHFHQRPPRGKIWRKRKGQSKNRSPHYTVNGMPMRLYEGHRHFFVLPKPEQKGAAPQAHRARGRLIDFEGVFYARAAVFSTSYEEEAPFAKKLRRFFVFVLQYARKYGQPPHTGSRFKKSADLWGKFPLWGQQLGGAISSSGAGSSCEGGAPCGRAHPLGGAASHRAVIRKIQNGGFYDP